MGASPVSFARCGVKLGEPISVETCELFAPCRGAIAIGRAASPEQELAAAIGISLGG